MQYMYGKFDACIYVSNGKLAPCDLRLYKPQLAYMFVGRTFFVFQHSFVVTNSSSIVIFISIGLFFKEQREVTLWR